jgi:hypothetical protein
MQKPSWCFVVNTMYSCPAARAKSMKVCGSNFDGLNRLGNSRYSASLMPAGVGVIMGQEASTLASEYGPQWMNMPNLASRYQRVRSLDKPEPNPRLRINGSDHPASASLMKSRREGEQALTRAEMLSRHLLVQNRSGSPSRSISFSSSAHERPGNDYFSDPDFRPGIVSA